MYGLLFANIEYIDEAIAGMTSYWLRLLCGMRHFEQTVQYIAFITLH